MIPGKDQIRLGGRLLKTYADQLGPVFIIYFKSRFYLQKMPKLWKEAIVVLVRNTSYPKTLNDLSGMNFY